MKHIIETEITSEEDEFGKHKDLIDPLSFLVGNLASNKTYQHVFRFKVTSIDESFEFKNTEVKKTVTLIDLVVSRQIYIFLNTLIYTAVYIIIHYLM